jgi:hypothetical protein
VAFFIARKRFKSLSRVGEVEVKRPAGNDLAIVDGDIAILEDELQGVLKALQEANINIVAIHNHMIMDGYNGNIRFR